MNALNVQGAGAVFERTSDSLGFRKQNESWTTEPGAIATLNGRDGPRLPAIGLFNDSVSLSLLSTTLLEDEDRRDELEEREPTVEGGDGRRLPLLITLSQDLYGFALSFSVPSSRVAEQEQSKGPSVTSDRATFAANGLGNGLAGSS